MSGFECSTFQWKEQGRRDFAEETQHYHKAQENNNLLHDLGIAVAREAILWPVVDRPEGYDFSPLDPLINSMNHAKVLPIWGIYVIMAIPTALTLLPMILLNSFARYCHEAAHYVTALVKRPG